MKYTEFDGSNPFGSQAKMLHHLNSLYKYKTTGDTSAPIFMEVNLTNRCNLSCEWCISENFVGSATLDFDAVSYFLWDFADIGGKAVTFAGGGEPTLHPKFENICLEAFGAGLDLGLMTNGVYPVSYNQIIGSLFQWVRFSLDTTDYDHYKKWKGVNAVDRVLANIRELKDAQVRVGVNCNVGLDMTIGEVSQLIKDTHGDVDYIQFRPILPRYFKKEKRKINHLVWDWLEGVAIYEWDNINLSMDKLGDIRNETFFPFNTCKGHFFNPILDATGDVSVCMYHPGDSRFIMGNIYDKRFSDIWTSEKRREVIQNLSEVAYSKECQVCCKLTELNKFIEYIDHPEKTLDKNFL